MVVCHGLRINHTVLVVNELYMILKSGKSLSFTFYLNSQVSPRTTQGWYTTLRNAYTSYLTAITSVYTLGDVLIPVPTRSTGDHYL